MMIIELGNVKVLIWLIEGKECVFNILGLYDVFGEIVCFDGRERIVDVFVINVVVVCVL